MPGQLPDPRHELIDYFVKMGFTPEVAADLAVKIGVPKLPTPPLTNGVQLDAAHPNMDPDMARAAVAGGFMDMPASVVGSAYHAAHQVMDDQSLPPGVSPGAGGIAAPEGQHIKMVAKMPTPQRVYMSARLPSGAPATQSVVQTAVPPAEFDPTTGRRVTVDPHGGRHEEFVSPQYRVTDTEGYSMRVPTDLDMAEYLKADSARIKDLVENPEGYSQRWDTPPTASYHLISHSKRKDD